MQHCYSGCNAASAVLLPTEVPKFDPARIQTLAWTHWHQNLARVKSGSSQGQHAQLGRPRNMVTFHSYSTFLHTFLAVFYLVTSKAKIMADESSNDASWWEKVLFIKFAHKNSGIGVTVPDGRESFPVE